MKKIIATVLACIMVIGLFAGCASKENPDSKPTDATAGNATDPVATDGATDGATEGTDKEDNTVFDYDSIPDTVESTTYELAFVTDVGQLKDKSFNQGTWEGLKRYASENGKTYKYYQPANGDQATDEDRYNAMKAAKEGGAKLIVAAGFLQTEALKRAAAEFPDVGFVFIDGTPLGLDNVLSIDFQEEQSGYLAGYAAVQEGFTKLGFSGGGGGENPACCRFAYGFIQGAEQAAKELNKTDVNINLSWEYGASFGPSAELQTMLNGWYSSGTEVIFVCGGQMCKSGFAAAAANDGLIIGVDVDQSNESDTVITSATKGLREAVMQACDMFYSDKWAEVAGGLTTLGAAQNAVGLPTDTWSMENFTVEQYEELFNKLVNGELVVDRDYEANLNADHFTTVHLNII